MALLCTVTRNDESKMGTHPFEINRMNYMLMERQAI